MGKINRLQYRIASTILILLLGLSYFFNLENEANLLFYFTIILVFIFCILNILILKKRNDLLDNPININLLKLKVYNIDKLLLSLFFLYYLVSLYKNNKGSTNDYLFYLSLIFLGLSFFKVIKIPR